MSEWDRLLELAAAITTARLRRFEDSESWAVSTSRSTRLDDVPFFARARVARQVARLRASPRVPSDCIHGVEIDRARRRSIFASYCSCCLTWLGARESRFCGACEPRDAWASVRGAS